MFNVPGIDVLGLNLVCACQMKSIVDLPLEWPSFAVIRNVVRYSSGESATGVSFFRRASIALIVSNGLRRSPSGILVSVA